MNNKKRTLALLTALVMACTMAACGARTATTSASAASSSAAYYEDAMVEEVGVAAPAMKSAAPQASEAAAEADINGGTGVPPTQDPTRKLIRTVHLEMETLNYDTMSTAISSEVARLGGYIENSSTNGVAGYYDETGARRTLGNRRLYVVVRVPQDKVDEFIGGISVHGSVLIRDESVTDVTLQYVDVESHKKALLIEQERLLALLEKAESIEDIIAIESRLSNVRYELESYESQLRTYDDKINYSTITISLQEVERMTPPEQKSVWNRISSGFETTIYRIGIDSQNVFVWIAVNLPYLIIWAVIITAGCFVLRKALARRRAKSEDVPHKKPKWRKDTPKEPQENNDSGEQ